MKQRILSAIIMILIIVPFFYVKLVHNYNEPLILLAILLAIVATTEMIHMKATDKDLPPVVSLLMYGSILYLGFYEIVASEFYSVSLSAINILPLLIILLSIVMVLNDQFKVKDAGFSLFTIFYIGLSFLGLTHFLTQDMNLLLYIITVAIATDTFAYFTGVFFGKHKLIPRISPKKTIEGALGGTIIATLLGTLYLVYGTTHNPSIIIAISLSLGLSIIGQFGDLIASKFKREYGIKDFGNLFPGHGGVLDRLDSILMITLSLYYLLQQFPQLLGL